MTKPTDPGNTPPLDASDPRLSEWIDGRLPAAEAAAVERAVAASAALTRLVADLEAIKQAARLAPAASPPAGFVDRVMDAVAVAPVAGGDDADADRAVEREWRAVEAERLAEERAEAEADLVSPAGAPLAAPGRVWPWLAIGTALAAGLLATVVINRPAENLREVAQVGPRAAARPAPEAAKASGGAGVVLQPPAPAAAAPAAPIAADEKLAAADMPPPGQQARSRALSPSKPGLAADAGGDDKSAKGEAAAGERAAEERGEAESDLGRMAAVPGPAELRQSAAAGGQNAAENFEALDSGEDREPGPVVLKVASWTDFDRLLEAHELDAKPLDSEGGPADRAGNWQLEISGDSAAIEAFLAAATDIRRRREGRASRADAGDPQADARKQADTLDEKEARRRSKEPSDAPRTPTLGAQRKLVVILQIEPPADGEAKPSPRPAPAAEKGAEP